MSLLTPTARALRCVPRHLRSRQCLYQSLRHLSMQQNNDIPNDVPSTPRNPLDPVSFHRIEAQRRAYYKRRSIYAGAGFVAGMIAIWLIAHQIDLPVEKNKFDAPSAPGAPHLPGPDTEAVQTVETGTSTVPTFPRTIKFSETEGQEAGSGTVDGRTEYQLLGLGIRTVSFLGIQVYVVGMYIATDDIAILQEKLIRRIDPVATTLVPSEKSKLREALVSPETSEETWSQVIKEANVRTLVRIVPTRNTDFGHLRDAWVRAMTARAQRNKEYQDETFGETVGQFKSIFSKGNVPKGKELLLSRGFGGGLSIWYDDGKIGSQKLGQVSDERLSRTIWLNYLGGPTVATEGARRSIVEGIMEFVERPVGTVATQVKL